MQDFERLGVFYLGKAYDLEQDKLLDDLVLYKSKDLTTHAVIIGMTGSGKTGLGIGILEEAAIDRIPVIAIDPKGDLGNMALAFPDLRPEDFRPWINLHEAANKGYTPDDYAQRKQNCGRKDWKIGARAENALKSSWMQWILPSIRRVARPAPVFQSSVLLMLLRPGCKRTGTHTGSYTCYCHRPVGPVGYRCGSAYKPGAYLNLRYSGTLLATGAELRPP